MRTTVEESEAVRGYASPLVCERLNIAPSTLNVWAKDRWVAANLLETTGRRSTRYWTPKDYVLIRVVKALRNAGGSNELIAAARPIVEGAWTGIDEEHHLYWDGQDLLEVTPWGQVQSRLQHPGQLLLHVVATPLQQWLDDAVRNATMYLASDVEKLRLRRQMILEIRAEQAQSGAEPPE